MQGRVSGEMLKPKDLSFMMVIRRISRDPIVIMRLLRSKIEDTSTAQEYIEK